MCLGGARERASHNHASGRKLLHSHSYTCAHYVWCCVPAYIFCASVGGAYSYERVVLCVCACCGRTASEQTGKYHNNCIENVHTYMLTHNTHRHSRIPARLTGNLYLCLICKRRRPRRSYGRTEQASGEAEADRMSEWSPVWSPACVCVQGVPHKTRAIWCGAIRLKSYYTDGNLACVRCNGVSRRQSTPVRIDCISSERHAHPLLCARVCICMCPTYA